MPDDLERAFSLALFIHQDRDVARQIATDAFDGLHLARMTQRKREGYRSASLKRGITKVSMSELRLLQQLVYIESGKREIAQERSAPESVTDRCRVVRFVEYLTRLTTRMSSFYVACGFGRVLYSYSTREVRNIYETITNDFTKDDAEYRRIKLRIIGDLMERFGPSLRLERSGADNEDRFQPMPDMLSYETLVRDCLEEFSPWETPCFRRLPANADDAALLLNRPDGSDASHSDVEMQRFHTLIHMPCFCALTAAFDLESPLQRLSLPRFTHRSGA